MNTVLKLSAQDKCVDQRLDNYSSSKKMGWYNSYMMQACMFE